jgi:hypothetical protein
MIASATTAVQHAIRAPIFSLGGEVGEGRLTMSRPRIFPGEESLWGSHTSTSLGAGTPGLPTPDTIGGFRRCRGCRCLLSPTKGTLTVDIVEQSASSTSAPHIGAPDRRATDVSAGIRIGMKASKHRTVGICRSRFRSVLGAREMAPTVLWCVSRWFVVIDIAEVFCD